MLRRNKYSWIDDQGKTTLFQKDSHKGTAPNNHLPITCLPMMWKILTAQVREAINDSLISCRLFPEEQKGCLKGADLFYTDQHILKENKTRRRNIAMTWIHYKKAYDMVLQSWIIDCLKMYKRSDKVISSSRKPQKKKKKKKKKLRTEGKSSAEVKIRSYLPGIYAITITICNNDDALVVWEMVNFSNTINHLATQMNNETSLKQHNKERFIVVAGVKECEWESVPFGVAG